MARLQRAAACLCAALLLSACAVDGAGLWGSKKTEEAPAAAKVVPAKAAPAAATTELKAVLPPGDAHNTYWCAPARGALRRPRRLALRSDSAGG